MKLRLFLTTVTSLLLTIVFAACSSTDYYRDRAVQRARKFLLQEDRSLSLEQREFVKFNKPVIMAAPIFVKFNSASATSGTLSHVCIAWVVPGRKNAYVVFGASDNRLRDWTPNRVVIKRYDKPAELYHKAKSSAIQFAVNNFLYLSSRRINRIRFEIPETIITDYKFSKATLKAKKVSEGQLKSLVQITFVWPSGVYGKRLFVCGLGAKDLKAWRPVFGGETSVEELRDHFIGSLSFGQFNPAKEIDKDADKFPEIKEPGKKKTEVKTPETQKTEAKIKAPAVKKTAAKVVEVKEPEVEVSAPPKKPAVKAAAKPAVKVVEVKEPEVKVKKPVVKPPAAKPSVTPEPAVKTPQIKAPAAKATEAEEVKK